MNIPKELENLPLTLKDIKEVIDVRKQVNYSRGRLEGLPAKKAKYTEQITEGEKREAELLLAAGLSADEVKKYQNAQKKAAAERKKRAAERAAAKEAEAAAA